MNEMLEKAKVAQANAYAAYSNFKVGVCIRSHNAQYFVGCNYENASYSVTCCAEGVAIGAMIAAGYREILEMVLIGASEEVCTPCGMCRQRIREFAAPNMLIHMFNHNASKQLSKTLAELLPYSFGPEHVQ